MPCRRVYNCRAILAILTVFYFLCFYGAFCIELWFVCIHNAVTFCQVLISDEVACVRSKTASHSDFAPCPAINKSDFCERLRSFGFVAYRFKEKTELCRLVFIQKTWIFRFIIHLTSPKQNSLISYGSLLLIFSLISFPTLPMRTGSYFQHELWKRNSRNASIFKIFVRNQAYANLAIFICLHFIQ
jgi:hypothetical protein